MKHSGSGKPDSDCGLLRQLMVMSFTFGLTGMTRDAVVDMTRWHLKHLQEGDLDQYTRVVVTVL